MKNLMRYLKVSLLFSLLLFVTTAFSQTKVYWVNILDSFTNKIQRADLDGNNVEDILTSSVTSFCLDNEGEKIYWTNFVEGAIKRADLNGNNIEDVLTGLSNPNNVDIDASTGKIYWTSFDTNTKIHRTNLDGSNTEEILDIGTNSIVDLELDIDSGKIYWRTSQPGTIQRADLDGSNLETLIETATGFSKIALDLMSRKIYWVVSPSILRSNMDGSDEETFDLSPTEEDQLVGIAINPQEGKMYWTDFNTEKIKRANLDGSNIEDVITSGLDSPANIEIGVAGNATAVNEDLSAVPLGYILRQNYPNPFNPLTTIEFSVPVTSYITLKVYDVLGNEIATLIDGELSLGNYEVDFNATNLTSGLYFGKISSGNFNQVVKMVLLK
jgi:DNA-binding beta-propeller fold protein YncE